MSETITQADRDAVADYLSARARASFANSKEPHAALLLDAFALHRASERQAIVDWLPSVSDALFRFIEHGDAEHRRWLREELDKFFGMQADAIERGEHLEAPSHE